MKYNIILHIMCNLLITNIKNIGNANFFQKFRGPDFEKKIVFDDILFLHNLLSITGEFYPQPYEDKDIIICFNGEIYNYFDFGNFKSDVEAIAFLYKKGLNELKKLEGEFAIVIYDKKYEVFYLIHDLFAIKPLFIGIDGNKFCISTYKSVSTSLGFEEKDIFKIPPNAMYKFNGKKLEEICELYEWDLKQHKNNYKDFFLALEYAVLRRTNTNKEVLVNLSSGYDSGVICCVLNKYNRPYNTASIAGNEDKDVLNKRIKINKVSKFKIMFNRITPAEKKQLKKKIERETENYHVDRWYFRGGKFNKGVYNFKTDNAIIGASKIYSEVRNKYNIRIVLSGSGADEIFSDYGRNGGRIFNHSCFGGKFPDDLSSIFPKNNKDKSCIWKNFYFSCQEAYLWKEEVITGLYGIEGRFPFLDKNVVQEFLWLSPALKNADYKVVLRRYLEANKYPFTPKKIGFNI